MDPSSWELIGRIALAGLIAALIGLEREFSGHPAGLRTHAIVGIGAALFTVSGAYGFTDRDGDTSVGRVAAQVVTGIGFLGAGAILRNQDRIKGLTTAASLWLCAGIGVSMGSGLVSVTLGAAGMTLLILLAVHVTDPYFDRRASRRRHSKHTPRDDESHDDESHDDESHDDAGDDRPEQPPDRTRDEP